jgi:hypothetical protein
VTGTIEASRRLLIGARSRIVKLGHAVDVTFTLAARDDEVLSSALVPRLVGGEGINSQVAVGIRAVVT